MPIHPGTVRAPDFPADLEWLNTDRPPSLEDLRGKIVLLDFWTYCCINCMHVLPDLKRLEHKYPDELVVVGVHSAKFTGEKETENIRQAVLRYEIEHPVVNDHQMRLWQEYAVRAWPTLILIDPNGKVIGGHSGERVFEVFDPVIARLVEHSDAQGAIDRRPVEVFLERERLPQSLLSFPGKVLADAASRRLFIADSNHNRIIVVSLDDATVRHVIGQGCAGLRDGIFEQAQFNHPQGMAVDGDLLYIADTENHAIRRAHLRTQQVETLAGNGNQSHDFDSSPGEANGRRLNSPWDLAFVHGVLFIAMAGSHQIWGLDPESGTIAGHAGSGREDHVDGALVDAALAQPSGLSTNGQVLFVADSEISSVRTVDLDPRGGYVRTVVGQGLFDFGDVDGSGDAVRLQHPLDVAYVEDTLYVADTYNNKIKAIRLDRRSSRTFAGTGEPGLVDGPAGDARFDEPGGLSAAEGKLYVADTNNHVIRVIDLESGQVSTLLLSEVDEMVGPAGLPLRLAPQAVQAGKAVLRITLSLPKDHHLNPAVRSQIKLSSGKAGETIDVPEFPMEIPLQIPDRDAIYTVVATIYFCREGREPVCLFHSASYELPFYTDPSAGCELRLDLAV